MIQYTKDLFITAGGMPPVIKISQYSDDFTIVFNLIEIEGVFALESGTTAEIRGTKTDGNGYSANAVIDITNKTVTVSGHKQMTAAEGKNVFEIVLWKGEKELATANFVLLVEPAAMDANTVPSETIIKEIGEEVDRYLDEHGIVIDRTLSQDGAVAESKTVGDNIRRIDGQIGTLGTRITNVEDDISYQSQRIDRTNKIKAPVIWEEASGNPAVFDDGADGMYIKDLTLTLTPSQDLHGYDYAWAGGNGKNQFDYNGIGSLDSLSNNNGTFTNTNTDTRTGFGLTVQQYNGTNYIKGDALTISESGRYSIPITIDTEITKLRIKHNGAKKDFSIDYPFTEQGTYCLSLTVISANPTVVGGLVFKDIMLEIGSTATEYEPYENICPISGAESVTVKRTGKNLCPYFPTSTRNGLTCTVAEDGSVRVTGTNNAMVFFAVEFHLMAGTYVLSGAPQGGQLTIRNASGGGAPSSKFSGFIDDYGNGATFTVSGSASAWLNIRAGAGTHDETYYPMIRPAAITDATYEPYSGIDTNVDFGQTIYGGTVNPILWNLQGGDIVFDRKVFSVGDLTWSKQGGNIFKATPDNVTGSASYDLSDTFRRNPVADSAMENGDYKLTVAGTLYVKMEGYGTAAGFKAAYADAKFCAKLAHSEIGSMYTNRREITTAYLDNVITALPDKGNVTNIKVTYPADTKAYIDKAIAAASL